MSYIFENQITINEIVLLTEKLAETMEGIIYKNLREKIRKGLIDSLSLPSFNDESSLTFEYVISCNEGYISSELGKIRKSREKTEKKKTGNVAITKKILKEKNTKKHSKKH